MMVDGVLSDRPWEYSAFAVRVARRHLVTPHFLRITLAGRALRHFAPWGLDQRIKLVLPMPDGSTPDFGLHGEPTPHPREWYTRWKALPEERRNVLRTYTPSAIRPEAEEIDVDVFVHEPAGPASRWALSCAPGDTLTITGPDIRAGYTGYGIHYVPPSPPAHILLVADESALPAANNILHTLGASVRVDVLLELADQHDDVLSGSGQGRADIRRRVVTRAGHPGGALEDAVQRWLDADGSDFLTHGAAAYAWVAGESGAVTRIRSTLADAGVPKERLAFLGYWKQGGPLVG